MCFDSEPTWTDPIKLPHPKEAASSRKASMNLMLFEIFAESFSDSLRSAVAAVKSFNPLEVDGLMSAANGLAWNEVAGAGGATGLDA